VHDMVRRYVKTGIAFLALGLLVGEWMLVRRELGGRLPTPWETSAHVHALVVGFVMMMILGVALWLFPRPAKDDTRYSPARIALAWWMLTLGTLVRVVGELAGGSRTAPALGLVVLGAGTAQLLGLALYFHTMWTRIRPLGSRTREEAGERF
jgi:cbb3-type cytochrome oxidase subunit 1